MSSHNSFDNQASALLDRHPQSPNSQPQTQPASSSPSFLASGSSPLVFAQSNLNLNLRRSVEDNPTPPPIPPHQLSSLGLPMTTVGAVLRSAASPITSSGCVLIDGQPQSIEAIQNLVATLREEIAIRDTQILRLSGEITTLRRLVGDRNRDVDQLRSVLDQKYIPSNSTNHSNNNVDGNNADATNSGFVNENLEYGEGRSLQTPLMPSPQPHVQGPPARVKKQGVCGESISRNANIGFVHYEKSQQLVTFYDFMLIYLMLILFMYVFVLIFAIYLTLSTLY